MAETPQTNPGAGQAASATRLAPKTVDAARAIRFLAIEAAIFIGIPVIAAIIAIVVLLK